MPLSHADCQAAGIPFKEHAQFRDFCLHNAAVDIDALGTEAKQAALLDLRVRYAQTRPKARQQKIAAHAEVAQADADLAVQRDRARHPDVKYTELMPEPAKEGAVPVEATLPPKPKRRRKRK